MPAGGGGFVRQRGTKVHPRARAVRDRALAWRDALVAAVEHRRRTRTWLDVTLRFYERDRDIDGGVVASAVALRLFLFFVPLLLVIVGVAGLFSGQLSANEASHQIGVTGGLARQIRTALQQSSRAEWLALGSGLVGCLLAGRNLARVLATAARRAWRLPGGAKSSSLTRLAGSLAGFVIAVGLIAVIINRLRHAAGVVGSATGVLSASVAYTVVWFVVSIALPRGDGDRTALLPGAVTVGAGLGVAQGLVQIVAPGELARASELYGAIGTVVVALGWFFWAGRLFILSMTVNAVVWERFGSIATWLLGWSPLRRLVGRHETLARLVDLSLSDDVTVGDAPPERGDVVIVDVEQDAPGRSARASKEKTPR
jgi:uncharacterized BrkB/YihY/UPF0761 family membrane protein